MPIKAQGGAVERRAATRAVAEPTFGEPGGADDLSVILVPTECLDAALALAKRFGDVSVAGVIGLALKRLAEQADRSGL